MPDADDTDSEPDASDDRDAATDGALARRRLLALSGVAAAGAIAGCGGDDGDGDGDGTPTGEPTTDPTPTATAAPTATPTSRPTTTDPTTTEQTTQPTTTVSYDPALVASPSSELQPDDGFASADWLDEVEPEILRVTNLNASGAGSLRAALTTEGPRIVIFEVGGVVDLRGEGGLGVDPGQLFVAGQTAPSPGITVVGTPLEIRGDQSIVQHLRVRVGDEVSGGQPDTVNVGSTASNVVIDHCSASWSIDENMSTAGSQDCERVSFSNNLVAEALRDSIHPKGPHSMGSLILNDSQDVSIYGNVYTHNENRNPRLKGGTTAAVVNNLVYNFGRGAMLGGEGSRQTRATFVGNHYVAGPATDTEHAVSFPRDDAETPDVYAEDNVTEPSSMPMFGDRVNQLPTPVVMPRDGFEPMPAGQVYDHNLATAGARPADRSSHDERILQNVADREGSVVDSQNEVGGYPNLESTERSLDPPAFGEGFTEWLFQHTLAVEVPGEQPP